VASLRFEPLLPIADGLDRSVFPYDPNPDAVFLYAPGQKAKAAAVESKFGEPYDGRGHKGIKRAYLVQPNVWDGLPHCRDLAARLCPDDAEFKHLHAAQLLKHLLGLKHAYGLGGFVLAYLWYDAPGGEGWRHRQEVEQFAEIASRDGIDFRAVIRPLCGQCELRNFCRYYRQAEAARVAAGDMPTVADLFAGAGGLSEGFSQAGFRILFAIDRDPEAVKT
jgi:hypothetical protein